MNRLFFASVLVLNLIHAPAMASGTVVAVEGSVTISSNGQTFKAARATPLETGAVLTVGSLGKVRLHFEDDSLFSIPGPTTLKVDEFRMPTGAGGRAVYTLESGGLRTRTGTIGRAGNDIYEMRTEEATIRVAGSGYSALRCQGSCATRFKAGLYVRAEDGVIDVANAAGQLKLRKGQGAFVARGVAPVLAVVSPLNDPEFAASFGDFPELDTIAHPPRIEGEPPASPS